MQEQPGTAHQITIMPKTIVHVLCQSENLDLKISAITMSSLLNGAQMLPLVIRQTLYVHAKQPRAATLRYKSPKYQSFFIDVRVHGEQLSHSEWLRAHTARSCEARPREETRLAATSRADIFSAWDRMSACKLFTCVCKRAMFFCNANGEAED
jgi:hypothetical protein